MNYVANQWEDGEKLDLEKYRNIEQGIANVEAEKEDLKNKVIYIDENSTHVEYPSARAVWMRYQQIINDILYPPEFIKIIKLPDKINYIFDEQIDYSGISVQALNKEKKPYGGFQNGIIPFEELIFPVKITLSRPDYNPRVDNGVYYISSGRKESICTQSDGTGGDLLVPKGVKYCGYKKANSSSFYIVAIGMEPFPFLSYTQNNEALESNKTSSPVQWNGQTYYVAYDFWSNPPPTPTINYTEISNSDNRSAIEIGLDIIIGGHQSTINVIQTLPVQWMRHKDGKVLETTMDINISA